MSLHGTSQPLAFSSYFQWKYPLERLIAAVLLIPGLMIIGILVLIIRLTSRGPAIFRQLRVGIHGKTYWIYKLRTMRVDAEAQSGPVWSQRGDPRITPLGRVLRKLHLDEFPQLFNVLRGEMALIGPRPERPEFTQQLALRIPNYMERLRVLPGITGLAQINLPPDENLDCVRRKVALDLHYIATAGFFLDMRMFLCTATRMVGISGEWSMRICGVKQRIPKIDYQETSKVHLDWPDSSTGPRCFDLQSPYLPTMNGILHANNGKTSQQNGFRLFEPANGENRKNLDASEEVDVADGLSARNGVAQQGPHTDGTSANGKMNGSNYDQDRLAAAKALRFRIP